MKAADMATISELLSRNGLSGILSELVGREGMAAVLTAMASVAAEQSEDEDE
jgi:hypothetical protein